MTDWIEDAGRVFEGLDAREAQAALAEELGADDALAADRDNILDGDDDGAAPGDGASLERRETDPRPDAGRNDGADPVWSAAQEAEQLRMAEALLFASSEPLGPEAIARRLPVGAEVPKLLETLERHYENRGVTLKKVAGKWRFATAADVAHVLEIEKVEPKKLSRAALETLAIIAYHQPCTRADIEDVRGVAVSKGSLDQLMEMGWIRLRGRRRDAPGRPVLYGTTPAFLEHFNLNSVEDLPGVADLKAAGLLDARLPPGFSIPTPTDASEDEVEEGAEAGGGDASETEFAQDFMAEDGGGEDG